MPRLPALLPVLLALAASACASLPQEPPRADEAGFRDVRAEPHYRIRLRTGDTPLPTPLRLRLPAAEVAADAADPGIRPAQAEVVAAQAARSVCQQLAPWVQWVAGPEAEASDAGAVTVRVRRIVASDAGLATTSAVLDALVPGPFRLPAGLGALEVDSRIAAADGTPLLELHWARGANPVLHRARASAIGDAWELAPSHARDLREALAALRPTPQPEPVRRANLEACRARFGEVSVAGRAASFLLPLSPEALDPADDAAPPAPTPDTPTPP